MMLCTLEMWPYGSDAGKYRLGEALISEIGGDRDLGHYSVSLQKSAEFAKREGPWRSGVVLNFRRNLFGPYDLLLRGLISTAGGRSHVAVRSIEDDALLFDPPSSHREVA